MVQTPSTLSSFSLAHGAEIASAAARPTNLPQQLIPFIGRSAALADVAALLTDSALVTLLGAGGVGKTRLAVEAARALLPRYPDGAWFVDLAPLADPALVTQALGMVFSLQETGDNTLLEMLCACLQPCRALLLFDNCEPGLITTWPGGS